MKTSSSITVYSAVLVGILGDQAKPHMSGTRDSLDTSMNLRSRVCQMLKSVKVSAIQNLAFMLRRHTFARPSRSRPMRTVSKMLLLR